MYFGFLYILMGYCKIILVLLTGVVFFCNCYANSRVYVSSGNLTNRAGNGTEVVSFASILGNEFSKLARDELGTMTMQAAFDRLEYEPKSENSAKLDLDSLVDQLSLRLRHYGHLVSNPQALVVQLHREHNRSPISPRFDCCNLSERDLRYEALYGARVSRRKCCDLIPFNLPVAAFNPGHNLTQRFRRQLEYWPNVKWLYFITAAGLHTEFPAHNFRAATVTSALVESLAVAAAAAATAAAAAAPSSPPPSPSMQSLLPTLRNWGWPTVEVKQRAGRHLPPSLFTALYDCRSVHQLRHREVFVRSVVAQPIWLVLVLDQSEASKTRMLLGQHIARLLLASLSEKDRVALVLASDTARVATVGAATSDTTAIHLLPATHETKLFLTEHVYSLRGPGVAKTNHTRALLEAFGILHDAVEAQKHDIPELAGLGLPTDNLMIAYISRGSLDDLQEQNATLQQVTEQQARLSNRVVINTYMPVEEKSATVLFEKTFMSDLAKRWNAHSNPEEYRSSDVRPGHFYTINRTADLAETVGRFYEIWLKRSGQEASERDERTPNTTATTTVPSSKLYFSLPYKDLEGKGLVMSISQAFYDGDTFLGIMGVDLHVADLLDQIIYYGETPASNFVFLLDASSSLSVYHPGGLRDLLTTPPAATSVSSAARSRRSSISASREEAFQRSSTFQEPLLHVDVRYLERTPGFENLILPRILRGEVNGTVDFLVEIDSESFARIETTGVWSERVGSLLSSSIPSPRLNGDRMKEVKITYRWRRITDPDTQFVLVMRSMQQVNVPPPRQLVEITPPFDSWYHRLDLFKRDQACLYLRQLATFSSTTVYLPPRTFMRPFEHLASYSVSSDAGGGTERRGETAEEVRHLVAYLTDQTALISNPGLRVSPSTGTYATASAPDVRTAVAVVERIGKFWRQRGAAVSGISTFGKHIIRRYFHNILKGGGFCFNGETITPLTKKYVSTDTGVMLMYPGTLMPQSFDATTRPWYLRAVENAGRIVFTEPYLDHGGAGHIVTIAFAIFEGNRSGIHSPRTDRVQSVMAMDVPYRLFNHLLSTWLPSHCNFEPPYLRHKSTLKEKAKLKKSGTKWKEVASKASRIPLSPNSSPQKEVSRAFLDFLRDYGVRVEPSAVATEGVESEVEEENEVETEEVNELDIVGEKTSTKCLLMNDRGYLIAHPGYAEPLQINRALESSHISHREPSVAADLLNHGEFVHKVACVSHSQRALERYYVYNTSYEGVVTNSAPGDHCTRYRFALVPGTNLFLGLVHEAPQTHQRIRRSDEVTTTSGGVSCSPRAAFCACSTKDRRCLNCGRLEPLECECPCQCPLSTFTGPPFISASTSATISPLDNHPACLALSLDVPLLPTTKAAAAASWKALARLPDAPPLCQPSNSLSIRVPVASLYEWLSILLPSPASSANVSSPKSESGIVADGGPLVPALGPTDCAALNRRATECTASIGCEFCLLGADAEPLSSGGFCAPMGVCFGGVVGSASPYSSPISSSSTTTFATSNGASPVGFLEDRWPLVPPPPPPPLPPPPLQLPPLGAQLAPLNGHYHYRNLLLPKSDSHATAAAHFYHYYYYYHYYHQQQQHQLLQHRGDDDFYASPYVLARHYMGGGGRSEAELGVSAGLMAWTNSPVGPVAGAVLAVFIVLLLGVYCLRHQAANRVRQSATATAVGNVGECASTGLLVGSGGGEATEGDASNQSACSRNHSGEKVCCCERPPESDTDKDKPPPTAGAVALLVKATSASSAASGADDHSISACGGSNAGTDTESERGPPRCCASPRSLFAPSAAAIIIEGVGVFVKSNAFSNEELAQVPEEPKSLPLAEFVTDPTAVSPYRVTTDVSTGDAVTVGTTADASTPADDQVTTVSSSAATTTDHGYVSNDRPSSSYAESSSLADSVVPGPTAASAGGAITVAEVIDDGEGEKEARSILGEPEMASAPGCDSSTAISGAWIGTLILGPGMDEVMCAEELEHQFLFSSKRGSNMQQPQQPLHNSQCGRLLPSWRKAYQHYRHLHHQYQHQYYQLQHHTCHPSHQHHQAGVGRSGGGLTRFPVLIQSPPLPSSTPTSPSPLSSLPPPTTSAHWGEPSEENIV